MTYHLGYFMHNDVQRAKADAVCPEERRRKPAEVGLRPAQSVHHHRAGTCEVQTCAVQEAVQHGEEHHRQEYRQQQPGVAFASQVYAHVLPFFCLQR